MNTIDQAAYDGDIVTRLRNWRGLHLAHGGELFEAAAGEIEKLRLADAAIRSDSPTLTSGERQAIEEAANDFGDRDNLIYRQMAENLRGLLERLK